MIRLPSPRRFSAAALLAFSTPTAGHAVGVAVSSPPLMNDPRRTIADSVLQARSRQMLPVVHAQERRVAAAIGARAIAELGRVYRESEGLKPKAGETATGCDVALQWIGTAAGVLGNARSSLATKRNWVRSDGGFVLQRVATFVTACEDDLGVPRSSRILTPELLRKY